MTEKYGLFKEPSYLRPGLTTADHRPARSGPSVLHSSYPKTGKVHQRTVHAAYVDARGSPMQLWPAAQGADATFSPLLPLGVGKPQPHSRCVINMITR